MFEELFYGIDCDLESEYNNCDSYDVPCPQITMTLSPPISMPSSSSTKQNSESPTIIAPYNDSDLRESNFLRRMQQLNKETSVNCFHNEIEYNVIPVKNNNHNITNNTVSNVKLKLANLSEIDQNIQRRANSRRAMRRQKSYLQESKTETYNEDFYIKSEVW